MYIKVCICTYIYILCVGVCVCVCVCVCVAVHLQLLLLFFNLIFRHISNYYHQLYVIIFFLFPLSCMYVSY